ncbi:isocitrate lyase/phosphoenolpyruvate mutase family protein [Duganella sp. Root1480D1]|uniref:isocitrate lyase/PEP mutase family protein n=1 Tax=Duganella sp. Root1480D1 TaxID=1736471 RepID=UPI00070949A1|nr:isocitrate lyase/phosphoenolpyruvate mutase family protein [Duganella sp. Root1480D1]KQZ28147.1 PEP phosphonomutase [Duganella sp. Root1480D1]
MRNDTQFHALHQDGILLLANCWDGGTARIAALAGAKALATSSAAVAWGHGYADGSQLPTALLLETVRDIVRASALPLTVDIEDGYSSDPELVGQFVGQLAQAGVVGINIEDGNAPPEQLARKISAAFAAAKAAGIDLYINARCDVYLRGLAEPGARVAETLRRAAIYQEAGASGLFAPGVTDEGEIAALAKGTTMPLNVLARPNLASPGRLAELGVRRLSAGSAPAEAMMGRLRSYMERFHQTGAIDDEQTFNYGPLNALMSTAR